FQRLAFQLAEARMRPADDACGHGTFLQMNWPGTGFPLKMDIRARAVKGSFALQHRGCEFFID
ncbi:MAG TPA: hypothetical protein PKD01_05115, partial [Mesorhizobium sp.]|nr:hypothetical protein [Mesorhizobium sp.]